MKIKTSRIVINLTITTFNFIESQFLEIDCISFFYFLPVSYWIMLSASDSRCSDSTSSCTTFTPLSMNYFICSIANWIFTILRLTTSSLFNNTMTTNTNTPPRSSSAPRIRFASGALTMSLSLLSVDLYSISNSYSTPWLFLVLT